MKKCFKRFISIISVMAFCLSMSSIAMAKEIEKTPVHSEDSIESTTTSTYETARATLATVKFTTSEFPNASGNALRSIGEKETRFSSTPTKLTYKVDIMPFNGGNVFLTINQHNYATLNADGNTHTIDISSMALPTNTNITIRYTLGTGTVAKSIILNFTN